MGLFSVAHFAIMTTHVKIHSVLGTPCDTRPFPTAVNYSTLLQLMAHPVCVSIQTKVAPLAFTWDKLICPHVARVFVAFPIQRDAVVE